MMGPCDCPEEEKPCVLCKKMQDHRKKRQAERRTELGLKPGEPLPCKCGCKCPKCQDWKFTECECEAAKKAGEVPELTCCFNRQSIPVERSFISDGTLKETWRTKLDYAAFRVWLAIRYYLGAK